MNDAWQTNFGLPEEVWQSKAIAPSYLTVNLPKVLLMAPPGLMMQTV
jgi:hypothetical protein